MTLAPTLDGRLESSFHTDYGTQCVGCNAQEASCATAEFTRDCI